MLDGFGADALQHEQGSALDSERASQRAASRSRLAQEEEVVKMLLSMANARKMNCCGGKEVLTLLIKSGREAVLTWDKSACAWAAAAATAA